MRFGFALPQVGSIAGAEALVMVAKRAEDFGFDSLWVLDRLLWPVNPRAPYPIGDGSLPAQYKNVLDPVETLTFVAAHTSRIALATGVLNLPWYNPVLLARRLTTLDVLSRGRLRVGFGIGWSPDEYEAAGATWQDRGKRADESIEMLKKIWTTDPVEFHGKHYRIAKSFIGPKPDLLDINAVNPPMRLEVSQPILDVAQLPPHVQGADPLGVVGDRADDLEHVGLLSHHLGNGQRGLDGRVGRNWASGGRRCRVVVAAARREALGAFGDDRLIL